MILNYSHSNIKFEKNTVIIAGAGPGSKKLVTLKLRFILKLADVIIYDALVNKLILKDCKEKVLLIYAGKTKKNSCTQSEINHLMVKYAKLGKKVLRLKGGDVSFFSRASQEVQFLKKNKIKFKVFTAITSLKLQLVRLIDYFLIKKEPVIFLLGIKKLIRVLKKLTTQILVKIKVKFLSIWGLVRLKKFQEIFKKIKFLLMKKFL